MSFAQFDKAFGGDLVKEANAYRREAAFNQSVGCYTYQYSAEKAREMGFYPDEKELRKREERMLAKIRAEAWSHGRAQIHEWQQDRLNRIKAHAADSWHVDEYFRQHGVDIDGPYAPSAQKAFQVVPGELSVFPFFWDTQIVEGILAIPLLDVLIMDTVTVGSGTAVHPVMSEQELDRTMGEVGEFSSFQELNIVSTEVTIHLKKYGGIVTVSDETMRRQRVPVFARGIARIGRQIGIHMTDFALTIAIDGDGSLGGSNGAPTIGANAAVAGSPSYTDFVKNDMSFQIGYEPTDRILGRAGITNMLQIPEFKDPLAGFKFQSQGVLPEVLGLQTHRWDSAKSTSWSNAGVLGDSVKMLTIQRQRALIMYQEGGLSTESFRDPKSEATGVKTSWYLGFAQWDPKAIAVGTGYA